MYHYVFIDSGIGGLPYLEALKKALPDAAVAFVADNNNFPYGEKTKAQIIDFSIPLFQKMDKAFKPQCFVIACNTLSVSAYDSLKKAFATPIVKTVPEIMRATTVSRNRRIGVLATARTVRSLSETLNNFKNQYYFELRPDPRLVEATENGYIFLSKQEKEAIIFDAVKQFKEADVDVLILACTHFLYCKKDLEEALPNVTIVDSVQTVVDEACKQLQILPDEQKLRDAFFLTKKVNAKDEARYKGFAEFFNLSFLPQNILL